MVMSHSFYRTLKAENATAEIDVMAPAWCSSLLAKMPEVNRALSMPLDHGQLAIGKRRRLGISLREHHYDRAYVLPNSFKSALVPFFAAIGQRTGWRGEMRYGLINDLRILDKRAFPLMVQRYVALACSPTQVRTASDLPQPLLLPYLKISDEEMIQITAGFNLKHDRPIIGLCPGAEFGPAKRWPHYHYASLARRLIDEKHNQIILLGAARDHSVGEDIRQALPEESRHYCLNLAGSTSLEQVIGLIAACRAIVSNDSGLMHIAAALDRPLVALYGPSSPDFTPPLSDRAKIIRLVTGYHKIRRGAQGYGYHQSLIAIQPEAVMSALEQAGIAG